MSNLRIVHVVPRIGDRWDVRIDDDRSPLQFTDLGRALDAATAIAAGAPTTRVVVHEPRAAA